jgi:RNA 2',3'-cyclic 3'-phosphodiesterase
MRLFFALPLPRWIQDQLARFQAQARLTGAAGSWPDPQGLHVTLVFLGEVEDGAIPALLDTARQAAAGHGVFPLKTTRLGGFPKNGAARVLWLGLEEQPRLRALVEALRRGLQASGVPFDVKPFQAHLTLARLKGPRNVACFQEPPPAMVFEAGEVVLYRSVQTPAGSRYLVVGRVPLDAG